MTAISALRAWCGELGPLESIHQSVSRRARDARGMSLTLSQFDAKEPAVHGSGHVEAGIAGEREGQGQSKSERGGESQAWWARHTRAAR